MKHLTYGGSTAHRTLGCPGWVKKSENIPRRPAGQAAIDGSMHHEVQENCQRDDLTPEDCIGQVYTEGTATREFVEDDLPLSEIAYNATNKLLDELNIEELEVEPFVQLLKDRVGGSIDLLGLSEDRKTLLILDYKFGSVKVEVDNSPNLYLYAASSRADAITKDLWSEVTKIVFAIVQPQVKGVVSTFETTPAKVDEFEKELMAALESDKINPGPHCKYCPAEPYCEEKRAQVVTAVLLGAREHKELEAAALMIVEVENWLKSMKEEMYLQLNRGVPIHGWKIVEKAARKKWIDAKAASAFLKEKRIPARDITNPAALRTPTQILDYLHKKGRDYDLSGFIIAESSGTTLAPEDDSREAVVMSDTKGHLADMMK